MADPFKYTLTFENVSVGNGANEAAAGVAKVAAEVGRLQSREADLRAEFSAVSQRFDVTRVATYNLGEEIAKTSRNTRDLSEQSAKTGPALKVSGNGLLQLAQAADDAQYGLRGILNNIPGLVLSLGGTAGLAGALSIGAILLSQFVSRMGSVEEKASDATDRIKSFADAVGSAAAARFDDTVAGIDAAAERTKALRQNWDETRTAESAYSSEALSNAQKLAQAQALIAEALGLQVDRFRELEAIAARQAEARRVAAENEIAAERAKAATARQAADDATTDLQAKQQVAVETRDDLERQRLKLVLLRQQRDELERIAQFGTEAARQADLASPYDTPNAATDRAKADAQSKLDSEAFQKALQGQQARVDALEEKLAGLIDKGGVLSRLENAAISAQRKAEDTAGAVSVNIQRIEQTLAADDLLARSQAVVDQGQALAAGLSQTLGKVSANSTAAAATKANLEALAADGKITADESVKLGQGLRELIGQVQSGLAGYAGNVSELIALQANGNAQVDRLTSEINTLKAQQSALEKRISSIQMR